VATLVLGLTVWPRERRESRRNGYGGGVTPRSLDLVIIGNGAAAAEAALAARAAGYRGELDLFADNPYPPYNPMLGPYYVSGAISQRRCFPFGGAEFYERNRVRAHLRERVVALAPWQRRLTTAAGSEYAYRACLVASGAQTSLPPIPGLDVPGVHGLRSFDDALCLKEAAALAVARAAGEGRRPRALVLGASFAGLKVADALRDIGMDVCIVEKEPVVLPLAIHPDCGSLIERHLREQGHKLMLGVTLDSVEVADGRLAARWRDLRVAPAPHGAASDSRRPLVEQADLLVVCTGSRPNLGFLAEGEVEADVGIIVDEHMRTSVPGLLAAGDVAQAIDPLSGRHQVVALWASARRQGRTAGRNLAGLHAEDAGCVSCNIQKVGDLLFASAGSLQEYDRLEVRPASGGLSSLAYRDGRLAGFNLLGGAAPAGPLACALARGTDVNAAEAAAATEWARRIAWMSSNAG
jgi:NADPH-dependent 2,4-dienoyl-CoA reductase/sulfur reductase-like enzyme